MDLQRDTDSRFEELLASLTVGVIIVDGRGIIRSVNPAAAVIFELGVEVVARPSGHRSDPVL